MDRSEVNRFYKVMLRSELANSREGPIIKKWDLKFSILKFESEVSYSNLTNKWDDEENNIWVKDITLNILAIRRNEKWSRSKEIIPFAIRKPEKGRFQMT